MASDSDQPRKKARTVPEETLGGLYDFLPPPDPERDAACKAAAVKRERPKLPPEDRSRVVFLDIDGVLLPAGSVETIIVDGVALPVRERMSESDFSAAALSNLRSIIQQTGASVVLSSEWRRTEAMRNSIGVALRSQDLPQLRDVTRVLPVRPELQRGDPAIVWCERRAREITMWLKQHSEVTSWVALDDLDFNWADSVRAPGTPLMKCRSVLTDPKRCLTDEDAAKAVRILLNPPLLTEEQAAAAAAEAVRATQEALAMAPLRS
mmetsp:Transcript_140307/g.391176  ORF Transcript_140307/g.391176 Transcript_140307/m.391176 type:complete len:265 (-) Transcript_140307:143-937(-)